MGEFDVDLQSLRELTNKLTENGYLVDQAAQWEYAFDAVHDLVMIVNPSLQIKFINKAFSMRLELTKEEVIDKNCYDILLCPNCTKTPAECFININFGKPILKTQKDVYIEGHLQGWFNFSHSPIFDEDDNLLGFICTLHDVTDRKEAEEKLKRSEESYRHLVKYAPSGIYEIDFINNKFTNVNDVMCIKTGYTREELLNELSPFDILEATSAALYKERLVKIFKGEEVEDTFEFEIIRKDGTSLWASLNIKYNRDENNNIIGAIVVSHDVTERKYMEDSLRKSEEKYRTLHDTMPLAALVYGLDCKILEWNFGAEKMFGWNKEEILGKNFFDFIILDKDKAELGKLARQLKMGDLSVINKINKNKTKDGNIIICEWFNSAYHDCKGKTIGIMSLAMDVTSKQFAENKLRENEALMKSIFKAAPAGIGLININQKINWTNNKLREMTGYSEEELINQKMRILYPNDDEYSFVMEAKYKQIQSEGVGNIETVWKRKDGRLIKVLLSSSPLDINDWKKGITFTALDITNL